MDMSIVTDRISQKIASKGKTADAAVIEGKLRRLVEEFGVPPAEAERAVTTELFKDLGIATPAPAAGGEKRDLNSIIPGDWVTIEGKVVALTTTPSTAIAQSGIVADGSGAIRFVVWAKANAPPVAIGHWYRFDSAVGDEYRGIPSIKVHSGTTVTEIPDQGVLIPKTAPLRDLSRGIVSVRAKVIQEWEANHPRMLQSGLLADETGSARFIIWKEEGRERLNPGGVYSIYYATADEFNGRISLNLTGATMMPEEGDIAVSTGDADVTGVLVHIAPGSGIIKRCPAEGCNRVLSRQNYCPIHEIQPNFQYDLRIKGWIDNGDHAWEVLMPRQVVEALTGMTLDQAREIAENNPLGMDEVFLRMRDLLLARFFRCRGREIDQRILASSCEPFRYDPADLPGLINRAGGGRA